MQDSPRVRERAGLTCFESLIGHGRRMCTKKNRSPSMYVDSETIRCDVTLGFPRPASCKSTSWEFASIGNLVSDLKHGPYMKESGNCGIAIGIIGV